MLQTYGSLLFKLELDNNGETQEDVTTCRMQQDDSKIMVS